MPRRGILRLVDQDVIDPEIELVEHPGGGGVVEQCERAVDQIVIIEQAAPVLFAAIAHGNGVGDGQQGACLVAAQDGAPPLEQSADAILLGLQPLRQRWVDVCGSPW